MTASAIFAGLIGIAGVLFMALAYFASKRALGFGAAGCWIFVSGIGFVSSLAVGDVYFILGFFGIGMAIVMALLGAQITESTTGAEEENPYYSSYFFKKRSWAYRQEAQRKATEPRARGLSFKGRTGSLARKRDAIARRRSDET